MKPTLVIVGRPNVGKSTLFNRITRSNDALVADFPGLTRDRHYGQGRFKEKSFLVVDTGGFEPSNPEGILREMAKQTAQAIAEADAVIFVVDGRQGLAAQDRRIADELRRAGVAVTVAVNKAEGMAADIACAEFHELGLGSPHAISAAHGEGVQQLLAAVLERFAVPESEPEAPKHPRIAIVGRPNAGKSTLTNALLGEERVIVFDQPGTTRDAIYIEFQRAGKRYTLIDTAGIRKRGKVFEAVEKFSVIKTLQAIEDANVVLLVLDAQQGVSEQDAHIAGFVVEAGRALVVAVNKWDGLDAYRRELTKNDVARKLAFLNFAPLHYVSALRGSGIATLFKSIDLAYRAAMARMPTPKLTKILHAATAEHQPPRRGVFRPRLKYAHQGGTNPPLIIVHGTALDKVPDSYRRFLENRFRKEFDLAGTPLRVEFRQGANPFV